VVCQICGALLAAAVGWGVLGASAGYPAPGIDGTGDVYPNFACVVAEMIGTMALVFGVLNSAVAQDVVLLLRTPVLHNSVLDKCSFVSEHSLCVRICQTI
jgi:glycerol uptake facilitator-like aquaporin